VGDVLTRIKPRTLGKILTLRWEKKRAMGISSNCGGGHKQKSEVEEKEKCLALGVVCGDQEEEKGEKKGGKTIP